MFNHLVSRSIIFPSNKNILFPDWKEDIQLLFYFNSNPHLRKVSEADFNRSFGAGPLSQENTPPGNEGRFISSFLHHGQQNIPLLPA